MPRRLITASLLLGGIALAACGSGGPGVQARQTGETTTTTAAPETTTTSPATTAPATTAPPVTAAATPAPCTKEALGAAYAAKFGDLGGAVLQPLQCVDGWATSTQNKGFDPPVFALYQAEGDHWVALNRSPGKLCGGYGVPNEVAPQIGCET